MRCAIYARAATKGECEVQLSELRDYVARRGWSLANEYVDVGTSRPQLARLMADANRRQIDCVLVWTLDRWGRSLAGCLASIQEIHDRGIGWIAVSQGIDMGEGNPGSRAMLALVDASLYASPAVVVSREREGPPRVPRAREFAEPEGLRTRRGRRVPAVP